MLLEVFIASVAFFFSVKALCETLESLSEEETRRSRLVLDYFYWLFAAEAEEEEDDATI